VLLAIIYSRPRDEWRPDGIIHASRIIISAAGEGFNAALARGDYRNVGGYYRQYLIREEPRECEHRMLRSARERSSSRSKRARERERAGEGEGISRHAERAIGSNARVRARARRCVV